jgi:hypothetical protein
MSCAVRNGLRSDSKTQFKFGINLVNSEYLIEMPILLGIRKGGFSQEKMTKFCRIPVSAIRVSLG